MSFFKIYKKKHLATDVARLVRNVRGSVEFD